MAMVLMTVCSAWAYKPAVSNDSLVNIQKTKKYTELWGQRATLFNNLGCDSTNIVMFGNSLTQGGEWSQITNNPKVLNRGIVGDIIQGLVDRIDNVVDGHPKKIFLLIGANDVSHDLTADSIATATINLVKLIRERTPQTKLYVQSLLPINNSFGRYRLMKNKEQVIRDINTKVQSQVEAMGIPFINLYPYFCDANENLRADWTNDGLHLRGEGYDQWYAIIKPYMEEE